MSDRPEQKLEPGHWLDRYELLCPIAEGGMASVWLARQHGKHGFEKLVAVKTILPLYAKDLRFQRLFLDEARIVSGIAHANVAQILDLGEEDDVLYLAMEWVDGDSLSKLFRAAEKAGEQLPVGVVCRILADTCAGLQAAHELRDRHGEPLHVVHRDVSPQNILVSTKGEAKLIDFGLAEARDRAADDASSGSLKGKILYMAPEQAAGESVDPRADVWAIGAVLYHLLAGIPPFEGASQAETLRLLASDDPPPPLPRHVPREVADVVARALVKEPSERVGTAEKLQRLLESAMLASGNATLQADVAMFVNRMLADRAQARRKAMELALDAAQHRQKLHAMLKPAAALAPAAVAAPQVAPEEPSAATLGSVVAERESLRPPRAKRLGLLGVVGAFALVTAVAVGVAILRTGPRVASSAAAGAGGDGPSPEPSALVERPPAAPTRAATASASAGASASARPASARPVPTVVGSASAATSAHPPRF